MSFETADFRTPGARIHDARLAADLTLEDLAVETRIPLRLLTAIEMDDYDQLSGPLYARSFLRNCADVLELDAERMLADYERLRTEQDPELPPEQTWETVAEVRHVGGLSRRLLWFGAAAVVVVGLMIWFLVARGGGGSPVPASLTDGPAAPSTSVSIATADTAVVTTPSDSVLVAEEAPGVPPDGRTTAPASVPALPAALPVGDPDLVFAGGETWPLVLRVILERRLDFAVGLDGDRSPRSVEWPRRPAAGVPATGVAPGRIYAEDGRFVAYWGAADHFVLRLPDAAGVTVTLNGAPQPVPPGSVGRDWVLDASTLGR
jgi:cytoskeleton protein RodZ